MSDLEAVGDAVTGGLVTAAVERRTGVGPVQAHDGPCLNCGAALTGPYCANCGQKAQVHRTLGAFFHDLAHGVLHFEGKIWKTLPLLAWKPGELTRRYIDGERGKFVSPIALFLFSVFMMFAVVSALGGMSPTYTGKEDLTKANRQATAALHDLELQRQSAIKNGQPIDAIDKQIADKNDELAFIRTLREKGFATAALKAPQAGFESDVPQLKTLIAKAKENPQLLLYKLKNNSYKWSWALIPLSVPFLWLLFPFSRRFRLYDHVVFVTYSLAFMSLLIVAGTALGSVGIGAIAVPMLLIPPWHIYRQLRGTYGLTRMGALWRTCILVLVAVLVLSLFIIGMVALGLIS
jgi:hypothetical protein